MTNELLFLKESIELEMIEMASKSIEYLNNRIFETEKEFETYKILLAEHDKLIVKVNLSLMNYDKDTDKELTEETRLTPVSIIQFDDWDKDFYHLSKRMSKRGYYCIESIDLNLQIN